MNKFVMAALMGLATSASAHHSVTNYFDLTKTLTVTGTVEEFRFVNPHSVLVFSVPGADGKPVIWRAESSPVAWLVRNGWKPSMFKKGDPITVFGNASRDPGSNMVRLLTVKLKNGKTLNANTGEGVDPAP